jgi:hypothetical protein
LAVGNQRNGIQKVDSIMDEHRLAQIQERRDQLSLQLDIIMASAISTRVKNIRIKYVTAELTAMRIELQEAIKIEQDNCTHGVAIVLHTGVGEECRCSNCDKTWESGSAYMAEMIERERNAEQKD